MPDPCHRIVVDSEQAGILATEIVPPASIRRWSPRRKAQVVRAVQTGLLSEAEACRRYCMTAEELSGWMHALDESGERGLRATKRFRTRTLDPFVFAWPLQGPVLRKECHARSH
jgi:hypothetical protein